MATSVQQRNQSAFQTLTAALKARLTMHIWELIWHGVFYVVLGTTLIMSDLMKYPDLRSDFVVSKAIEHARNFTMDQLEIIYHYLLDTNHWHSICL